MACLGARPSGPPGLRGPAGDPSGLRAYHYEAADGSVIRKHTGSGTADVGRGMAGDLDPRHLGMEVWSFSGLFNSPTNRLAEPDTSLRPWPHLGLWWDGDTRLPR